jgi:hypothetical protein
MSQEIIAVHTVERGLKIPAAAGAVRRFTSAARNSCNHYQGDRNSQKQSSHRFTPGRINSKNPKQNGAAAAGPPENAGIRGVALTGEFSVQNRNRETRESIIQRTRRQSARIIPRVVVTGSIGGKEPP